jgi:hypothetical protein
MIRIIMICLSLASCANSRNYFNGVDTCPVHYVPVSNGCLALKSARDYIPNKRKYYNGY